MTRKLFFNKNNIVMLVCSLIGTFALLSSIVINPINHYISSFILVGCAIVLYFIEVFFATDKNWLDIRAVFTGVWLGTIGLASFRLTNYQEEWIAMTWVWLAAAYAMFSLGSTLGMSIGTKWFTGFQNKIADLKIGRVYFSMKKDRLFWVCIITTLIGFTSFVINASIKGLPFFSGDPHAYTNFYTRFQIFSVAAQAISGLCYYCIKTQPISKCKKGILCLCILYNVVLYPVLIVSRGTFLAAAISFTVAFFYLNSKKLIPLLLCLLVMFSVYLGCATLRNYTDEQLSVFFEPTEIILNEGVTETTSSEGKTENKGNVEENKENNPPKTFSLSPKVAWTYSYFTVSHDNFNEAVQNLKNLTWGTRQMEPFNVFLRSEWINERNSSAERHQVREHLNTVNLIGDFYYDFGGIGIIICMLIWSFLFGVNQGLYEKHKSWIYLLLLGNTLVPIILSFFASWTSIFSQWVLWGVVFIFAIAASVCIKPKTTKQET